MAGISLKFQLIVSNSPSSNRATLLTKLTAIPTMSLSGAPHKCLSTITWVDTPMDLLLTNLTAIALTCRTPQAILPANRCTIVMEVTLAIVTLTLNNRYVVLLTSIISLETVLLALINMLPNSTAAAICTRLTTITRLNTLMVAYQ